MPWNSNGHGGSGLQNPALVANLEYDLPSQVIVDNSLTLLATQTPTAAVLGDTPETYQWRSGIVSTYGKFQFTGGFVQIDAKMPVGSGMWPSLWLLPGPGGTDGDNTEIDIFEGGFLGNGVSPLQNFSWHMHTSAGLFGGVVNAGVDLSAGYHVYGFKWLPNNQVDWYLDGKLIGQITQAKTPIPDEPMELIMSLAVANSTTAGYRTAANASTPSSGTLSIRSVQVYS